MDKSLEEIIQQAKEANAALPHGIAATDRQAASVTCNCGRTFEARTIPQAFASHQRHALAAIRKEAQA